MADSQKKFLFVSNPRCGSTWLAATFGKLEDVAVDYEFCWKQDFELQDIHMPMDRDGFSTSQTLEAIAPSSLVVGSKLVLDAHRLIDYQSLDSLFRAIEKEVRIIHLQRNYFDSLLSLEARGAVQHIDISGKNKASITNRMKPIEDLGAKDSSKPPSELVRKLLIFFCNDLVANELCKRADKATHLDYETAAKDAPRIAQFMGLNAGRDEVEAIFSNPDVKKLPQLSPNRLASHEKISAVASVLERARNKASHENLSLFDFLDTKRYDLRVSGLREAVADATEHKNGLDKCLIRLFRKSAGTNAGVFRQLVWKLKERF